MAGHERAPDSHTYERLPGVFSFDTTPVKFVGLLVMFAFCAAWCVYEVTRRQDARRLVSNILHLAMALVMLLMVPTGTWQAFVGVVPMPVLVGIFAASTLWFLWLALGARRDRSALLHSAGHAAMFAAMTWHLGAMAVKRAAMTAMGASHGSAAMKPWTADASRPGGVLWLFALVGVPFMLYLLVAGLAALRTAVAPVQFSASSFDHGRDQHAPLPQPDADGTVRVLAKQEASCHEVSPVGSLRSRTAALSDASMNLGMFWMSTGLLVPLLPFMAVFAF